MDNTDDSESVNIEFTKEEVEALLNEKPKGEKFDPQAKVEQMFEHNRRLRLCVGWFRKVDENNAVEKENFQKEVESAEKNIELEMKNNDAEFNATILELRKENASVQEKALKEESDYEGGIVKERTLIAKLKKCQESRRKALRELDLGVKIESSYPSSTWSWLELDSSLAESSSSSSSSYSKHCFESSSITVELDSKDSRVFPRSGVYLLVFKVIGVIMKLISYKLCKSTPNMK